MNRARWEDLKRIYREEGFKKAFAKWRYNYIMLDTPEYQLSQKAVGYAGSMVFLLAGCIILTLKGLWPIGLALAFTALVQYVDLKGVLKQRRVVKNLSAQQKALLANIQGTGEGPVIIDEDEA
jgi:hypothetical protein